MPQPSQPVEQAERLVSAWLHDDENFQFLDSTHRHRAHPRGTLNHLMHTELASRWGSFSILRRHALVESKPQNFIHSSQAIMRATSAARIAIMWDGIVHDKAMYQTSRTSFNVLQSFFRSVNSGDVELPSRGLLDEKFERAIHPETITPVNGEYPLIVPVFTTLAAHAVNHLLEQDEATGQMQLPMPGLPGGEIQPWKNTKPPRNSPGA
jgi:hypothetical protein